MVCCCMGVKNYECVCNDFRLRIGYSNRCHWITWVCLEEYFEWTVSRTVQDVAFLVVDWCIISSAVIVACNGIFDLLKPDSEFSFGSVKVYLIWKSRNLHESGFTWDVTSVMKAVNAKQYITHDKNDWRKTPVAMNAAGLWRIKMCKMMQKTT